MKRPYIKKFVEISHFKVWIVDGKYIRDNIDEEFNNYGQHYQFNFIPEKEFWIDKERAPGEERFYIDSMLVMNRLISKNVPHDEAVKMADKIELRERSKSRLMKKEMSLINKKEELIKSIHKRLLSEYSKKVKVWIVNGEVVRDLFFIDFTEGGHDFVYSFIPKNEVWIDDDLNSEDIKFVILHEVYERRLMSKGMDYDSAHKRASHIEYSCRHNRKKIDIELKKEINKQKIF